MNPSPRRRRSRRRLALRIEMGAAKESRAVADRLLHIWQQALKAGALPPVCGAVPSCSMFESRVFGKLLHAKYGHAEHEQPEVTGLTSAALIRWAAIGAPQFQLTAGSGAAFVLTEVDEVRWEDVRFPFDHYCIRLPSPSPLTFVDFDQKERDVTRILVTKCTVPSVTHEEQTSILRTVQSLWDMKAPVEKFWPVIERLLPIPAVYVEAGDDSGEGIHRQYLIPEDGSVTLADWCSPGREGVWQHERSRHAMTLVCRVVACLSLYLDHSDGPESKWDRTRLQRNKDRGKGTTWTIGEGIKLPKALREAARYLGMADRSPAQWKLQSRQCVRGYFRNQPYGHGRQERRRQWVAPYWRGPETAEVSEKTYVIGSDG